MRNFGNREKNPGGIKGWVSHDAEKVPQLEETAAWWAVIDMWLGAALRCDERASWGSLA